MWESDFWEKIGGELFERLNCQIEEEQWAQLQFQMNWWWALIKQQLMRQLELQLDSELKNRFCPNNILTGWLHYSSLFDFCIAVLNKKTISLV